MMLSIAVTATLLLNEIDIIKLSNEHTELYKKTQAILISTTVFIGLLIWVGMFIFNGITKYKLHDIAGIIGSAMFMVAFIGIIMGTNLVPLFILSGFFCLYCSLIPLITIFLGKFSNSRWEPALLWTIMASISIYVTSTLSNVILNETFGIDAKFFSQTKPVAMLLLATPLTASVSFSCLLFSTFPLIFKNKKISFYSINGFFSSYVILILSLAYGGNISGVLEKTAALVDFNSNHPCILSNNIEGVIFLDPTFKYVLAYNPTLKKSTLSSPVILEKIGLIK